jgi:hypothetical protein
LIISIAKVQINRKAGIISVTVPKPLAMMGEDTTKAAYGQEYEGKMQGTGLRMQNKFAGMLGAWKLGTGAASSRLKVENYVLITTI